MPRYVLPVIVDAANPAAARAEVSGTLNSHLPDGIDPAAEVVEPIWIGDACSIPAAEEGAYLTHMVYVKIGGQVYAAMPEEPGA
jgi:hypothetical protein